jgi:hypothetical protein
MISIALAKSQPLYQLVHGHGKPQVVEVTGKEHATEDANGRKHETEDSTGKEHQTEDAMGKEQNIEQTKAVTSTGTEPVQEETNATILHPQT